MVDKSFQKMDLFSNFCNICCKIDNGSLKDISEENMKHLNDTFIRLVGHVDILKHDVIYLCNLCCEELTRFGKFQEMCFSNLICFRQKYYDMKLELELENGITDIEIILATFVHEEILRRSSLENSNYPVLISTECHEILKTSADLNKNDSIFNKQLKNLQSEMNERQFDNDCGDVIDINGVSGSAESRVTFTNEADVGNGMVRLSEDIKFKQTESESDEDFHGFDINNTNENYTLQMEIMKEEFYEIDGRYSKYLSQKHFENESVDVEKPVVNSSEGSVHLRLETSKEELYIKEEKSSHGLENEFGDGLNVATVRTIENMENCQHQNITNEAAKDGTQLRSRHGKSKLTAAIMKTQPSPPNEQKRDNERSRAALQSAAPERVYQNAEAHTCTVCNQSFRTSSCLIRHECSQSISTPYKCIVCDKTFVKSTDLNKHNRTHSGVTSCKCTVCNKIFRRSQNLTRHIRTHTGDRPYKCTFCNKMFKQSAHVILHERIHTGDRPYNCTVCNKAFKQSSALINHNRTHNGDRPYKCTECKKAFAQSSTLIRHKRTHSGD